MRKNESGNAGVGKTCLVRRFTQGMFPPGQGATIGVDFMIKTVEIDGEKIKVSIHFIIAYLNSLYYLIQISKLNHIKSY